MRKTGEQLDKYLVDTGVISSQDMQDATFVKIAMIERVMHNLQSDHEQLHKTPLWDKKGYADTLSKTAAAISVNDIASADKIDGKIELILKEI